MTNQRRLLVVGIGNPSRTDDGVGQYVVDQLRNGWFVGGTAVPSPSGAAALTTNVQAIPSEESRRAFTSVDVDCVHQLTPELAEEIKDYDVVVFVDARVDGNAAGIELSPVEPIGSHVAVSHYWTAESLLALTQQLFGRAPQAFILSIPGRDFGFGDRLSEETKVDADLAVLRLEEFIASSTL